MKRNQYISNQYLEFANFIFHRNLLVRSSHFQIWLKGEKIQDIDGKKISKAKDVKILQRFKFGKYFYLLIE